MNWIESLYQTYQNNTSYIGSPVDKIPLAPVAHTVQQTLIEITIDQDGAFLSAKVEPLITIIPCTEASAGRTNSPVAHPLVDKLQYVASDFYLLTGENDKATSKKPKNTDKKSEVKPHHIQYRDCIAEWANSAFTDPKIIAIHKYLETNDGKVLSDICRCGIYPLNENNFISKKWQGDKDKQPPIYKLTKNSPSPWDAFVRWRVEIPGINEDRTYFDPHLWDQWIAFNSEKMITNGICYITGEIAALAQSHPKRIRSIADGAKLISSNDGSGFTFRGRFTDPSGDEAASVSFDVTQKAHNALRWLIAKQGTSLGEQAIVAWSINNHDIPDPLESSLKLVTKGEEENDIDAILEREHQERIASSDVVNTGQCVALTLKQKILGYRKALGDTSKILVLSLDSATPGRMAITYFRELTSGEFLDRIESWHDSTAWLLYHNKGRQFYGAPSPYEIALIAFGKPREDEKGNKRLELDDKLKSATYRRLLPCIIESRPIPDDLVNSCIQRASARVGLEDWEWEKAISIACALYRKQQIQKNNNHYSMSLERIRTTRSYLYGRLLAVADKLEEATYTKDEKRVTHAARFTQAFAIRPYTTWANIEKSLEPYKRNLATNKPGLFSYFDNEFRAIMDLFTADEFIKDDKLDGEFLLAYHCQRTSLIQGNKKEESQPDDTDTSND